MQSADTPRVHQDQTGLYIGILDEEGHKDGVGLNLKFSKDQELVISYWKNDLKDGKGIKLQSGGVGFCGSFNNDSVDDNALYFLRDGSIKECIQPDKAKVHDLK